MTLPRALTRSLTRAVVPTAAALGVLALAACGSSTAPAATSAGAASSAASASAPASSADACAVANLPLTTAGRLTVATDQPVYPPWFVDNKPESGKGFESAVAYALAEKMGFTKDQVTWVRVPFDSAVTPGKKAFDLDLNEFSITEDRKKAVDFSSGYYDVRQTVITYKGSPIDGTTSMADLAKAKLGAQIGTTSYTALKEQIKPTTQIMVYKTNDLAVQALKNKQIDGIVVDLPTAFYMTGAQIDNGVIVGQLPAAGGTPEQFGALLSKDSGLTGCVTKAVDALRADGTLDALAKQWLTGQGAPELK